MSLHFNQQLINQLTTEPNISKNQENSKKFRENGAKGTCACPELSNRIVPFSSFLFQGKRALMIGSSYCILSKYNRATFANLNMLNTSFNSFDPNATVMNICWLVKSQLPNIFWLRVDCCGEKSGFYVN